MERSPDMSQLHSRKIRFFTSKELLRIFGFPDSFDFPLDMPLPIRYRLIGQSINVLVVRALMHSEFCNMMAQPNCSESTVNSENISTPLSNHLETVFSLDVLDPGASSELNVPLNKKQRIEL